MMVNGSRFGGWLNNGHDVKEPRCKMVILGCTGVGKTALTVRFLTKRFIGEYCPTLESIYKCYTQIDDEDAKLEILDTAGGQITDGFREGYALWADCFIFVYSITDRQSFLDIPSMKKHVETVRRSTSITAVLIANKSDLLHDRKVTWHEGVEMADELGFRIHEVSASDWTHVSRISDIFSDLYREFRRAKSGKESRQRKTSSSQRFKQAIQKVITGKSSVRKTSPF